MAVDTLARPGRGGRPAWWWSATSPALESRLHRLGLAVEVVAERGAAGMNAALSHGAERAARGRLHARCWPVSATCPRCARARSPRCSTPGPAVTPAPSWPTPPGSAPRCWSRHGVALDPRFQGRSAAAHRSSGAVALDAGRRVARWPTPGATWTPRSTWPTPSTSVWARRPAALVDPATERLGTYGSSPSTDRGPTTGTPLAVTSTGHRVALPTRRAERRAPHARPGSGCTPCRDDRVLAAWL